MFWKCHGNGTIPYKAVVFFEVLFYDNYVVNGNVRHLKEGVIGPHGHLEHQRSSQYLAVFIAQKHLKLHVHVITLALRTIQTRRQQHCFAVEVGLYLLPLFEVSPTWTTLLLISHM